MNDEIKDWKFFVPRPWYNEPRWPVEIASHSTSDMFLHKEKRVILHKLLFQSNLAMALSHACRSNFKPTTRFIKILKSICTNDLHYWESPSFHPSKRHAWPLFITHILIGNDPIPPGANTGNNVQLPLIAKTNISGNTHQDSSTSQPQYSSTSLDIYRKPRGKRLESHIPKFYMSEAS